MKLNKKKYQTYIQLMHLMNDNILRLFFIKYLKYL